MILVFPDLDTFRLVLTAGIVPADVSLVPAAVSTDTAGRLFVETDGKLPKKTRDELDRLKVVGAKRHAADPRSVTSWLEVLPLIPDPAPPQLSSQAPVLFELPSSDLLPAVVTEMLRLGNDRQGYRWLAGEQGDPRVLLRVIGPPFYTLLRALDKSDAGDGTVRAYTEQAPRVWVELGHTHPLAKQIKLGEGTILLIRTPRDWAFLPDAPFHDVYDILQFTLPSAPTEWAEAPVQDKLTVPLRLVAGNAADVPELWVIRGAGVAQLDRLVRDADDRLTEQLTFAVAKSPTGEETVVLRTRPSKRQPPVLALDGAVGFKPYWRLPNLYLPAGTRLHPAIRRDAVAKLLADDRDQLVWLYPGEGGTFTPESLPEDSFRPLQDWVEYVIDSNKSALVEWVEATTFDFDSFVCAETTQPKPKGPGDKSAKDRKGGRGDGADEPVVKPAAAKPSGKPADTGAGPASAPSPVEVRPPSEWKVRCDELEKQFLALDGPLDAPERGALWPELAAANAGLGDERRGEAAVCWANALWEQTAPPAEWVEGWFRSEVPGGKLLVAPADFDQRMKPANPTMGEARAFVATLLAAASRSPAPDWLRPRLPAAQKFLEAHEDKLPIRAVWLAAVRLAQLSGTDVLGLARVRDRLLARLLEKGLNSEQDLPTFLRYAGSKDSDRARVMLARAVEIHRAARDWTERSLAAAAGGTAPGDTLHTLAFLDLMFAFGLAKLGEVTRARALVESAKAVLDRPRPPEPKEKADVNPFVKAVTGHLLFRMFEYRIDRALAGKPHAGLLPAELLDELDAVRKKKEAAGSQTTNPYGLTDYAVTRMREQSKILEPQEKLSPYLEATKGADELRNALAELPREKDPARLGRRIRELFKDGVRGKPTPESRFWVLYEGLPLAARVGQDLTVELLGHVPAVLRAVPTGGSGVAAAPSHLIDEQGKLVERSLFLAAHFDQPDLVQRLADQFIDYAHAKPDNQRFELVSMVAGQSLRSLRKVGLRDEIDKLLRRMQDEVLKGKSLPQLRQQYAGQPNVWADVLITQLHLAAGWLSFGLIAQAAATLDAARQEILAGGTKVQAIHFAKLCRAYLAAVSQGPAEDGLVRVLELFQKLAPGRLPNSLTTSYYYSRLHLNLAEEVVLAIVSDEFTLGQAGRRWLDEDEYLVRRRIHRDVRQLVVKSGL